MQKKVLLIDDDDVDAYLESIEEKVEDLDELEFSVRCKSFNPVSRDFEDEKREIDFEKARQKLIETHLDNKIDVIGCDFNLHKENKVLTFDLIEAIREYNKSCTIFIYSGAPLNELSKIFKEKGKNPGEKLWQLTIVSNISEYVNNRDTIPDKVISFLRSPSIILQMENFLTLNGKLQIKHAYQKFKGKQLFEIAREIRKQTNEGIEFSKEIIEHGLSHLIDLNSFPDE